MQQVKIVIVCRFNQARSIVVAAMLRKLLPHLQIATCGVEGKDGKPIPVISSELCKSWGLTDYDRISRSLSLLKEYGPEDFILAADEMVFDQIHKHFPYLSVANLASYADDSRHVPSDPAGLGQEAFMEEIAKACLLAMRWLDDILGLTTNTIEAHIFETQNSLDKFRQRPNGYAPGVKTFVDTELAYPETKAWSGSTLSVTSFDPRHLDIADKKSNGGSFPRVLVSRFESDFPSQLLLSQAWRAFLINIAQDGPIALICRNFSAGPRSVSGALAAINSTTSIFHN